MTNVKFPIGSVLAKTYSQEVFNGESFAQQRIETQIAIKDQHGDWQYYTYRWNDNNSDASLVSKEGEVHQWMIASSFEPGGKQTLDWTYGARSQCKVCHSPWTGETLGFIEAQLRDPNASKDSWRELAELGVLKFAEDQQPRTDDRYRGVVNSHDTTFSLDSRARSYLHANCSHCHIRGGNASTNFDLRIEKTLQQSDVVDAVPMRGGLGLDDTRIVAAGNPSKSVLLFRMAKLGMGICRRLGQLPLTLMA